VRGSFRRTISIIMSGTYYIMFNKLAVE
jgi:hypothetical protein